MKTIFFTIIFLLTLSLKAQITPLLDHTWTIEQIDTGNQIITASPNNPDNLYIWDFDFLFSGCEGFFNFNDSNQSFEMLSFGCIVTTNFTPIADEFVNEFILQDAGVTSTPSGLVYGPFSYSFTYSSSGDIVYLHIDNLAGSVATFYSSTLSNEEFLKNEISVYPNPVTNLLNIDNSSIPIETVKVYDLSGRLINGIKINDNQIDVSQLQNGMYILNIETSIGILSEKLIKL